MVLSSPSFVIHHHSYKTMVFESLVALSTGVLGIFLGAQITEAFLFVPYWKALSPKDFFDLHQRYGKKIHAFFAPLTILATLIPLFTLAYGYSTTIPISVSLSLMGAFTVLFFSTFFVYFKKANKQFAEASIPYEELPTALNKWGNWHWGRIVFECLALICAIMTLIQL